MVETNRKERVAVVAAVLITAGLGTAVQAAPPSPSPADTAMLKQERMYPTLEKVRRIKNGKDGPADPAYTGDAWDPDANQLTVFRVGGGRSPQADGRYTQLSTPDLRVVVRDALVSEKDAARVRDAIEPDLAQMKAEGIDYTGLDVEGNSDRNPSGRLMIEVVGLTPAVAETMLSRYADTTIGRDKVVVVEDTDRLVPASGRQDEQGGPCDPAERICH